MVNIELLVFDKFHADFTDIVLFLMTQHKNKWIDLYKELVKGWIEDRIERNNWTFDPRAALQYRQLE